MALVAQCERVYRKLRDTMSFSTSFVRATRRGLIAALSTLDAYLSLLSPGWRVGCRQGKHSAARGRKDGEEAAQDKIRLGFSVCHQSYPRPCRHSTQLDSFQQAMNTNGSKTSYRPSREWRCLPCPLHSDPRRSFDDASQPDSCWASARSDVCVGST